MNDVVIVHPRTGLVEHGRSDLRMISGMFFKVVNEERQSDEMQLVAAAYVYKAEHADVVTAAVKAIEQERKDLDAKHYKDFVALQDQYGARVDLQIVKTAPDYDIGDMSSGQM